MFEVMAIYIVVACSFDEGHICTTSSNPASHDSSVLSFTEDHSFFYFIAGDAFVIVIFQGHVHDCVDFFKRVVGGGYLRDRREDI